MYLDKEDKLLLLGVIVIFVTVGYFTYLVGSL